MSSAVKNVRTRRGDTRPGTTKPGEQWQIQTAKARFSEVFRLARTQGPQRITRQGKETVVMISGEDYDNLLGKSRRPKNLVDFFRQSPMVGVNLDLVRDKDSGSDVEL